MFKNYLLIAFRSMRKNKLFTFINLFGLIIGLTSFILIFSWVAYEFSFDRFNTNYNQIHRLCVDLEAGQHMVYPMSMPNAGPLMKDEIPEILDYCRLEMPQPATITIDKDKYLESEVCHGDNSIFNVFSFDLIEGNPEKVLVEPYTVVVSESIARKYFGRNDAIGESLNINGKGPYVITGIFKDIPSNSHFSFNIMGSFKTLYSEQPEMMNYWFHIQFYTYLLIDENADLSNIKAKFESFTNKHMGEMLKSLGTNFKFFLQPLSKIHLYSDLSGDISSQSDIRYIFLFFSIALFVLLIACINYINITTANTHSRAKEIGLRKTIGSSRSKIILQFLFESIIFSFIATMISLVLVELVRPFYYRFVGTTVNFEFLNPTTVVGFIVFFPALVGFVAGSYPSLLLSKIKPAYILKPGFLKFKDHAILRNILVVFQFSISIFLIISTLVINKQIKFMKHTDPGFKKENVLVISGMRQLVESKTLDPIVNNIKSLSEVSNLSVASLLPTKGTQKAIMYPEGFSDNEPQMGHKLFIDPEFIPAMGIEILKGRNFSEDLATDMTESVIINETAANSFGWEEPIGKIFRVHQRDSEPALMKVVGVVNDFHLASMKNKIEPLIMYYSNNFKNFMIIRFKTQDISSTIANLKKIFKKHNPDFTMNYSFLEESLDRVYWKEKNFIILAISFCLLTILLACLGLFGLTSSIFQNKIKEIGIRKTLGASSRSIVYIISRKYFLLVFISLIIASPVSYLLINKWLSTYAYRTEITFLVFVISGLLSLSIAFFTVIYQTIKAANSNPVEALKYE